MPFARELPNISLKELAELVVPETKPESFLAERIFFPVDITSGIGVRDHKGDVIRTLPGQGAYLAFARFLDFPTDLLDRLEEDFVSQVYNRLLAKAQGPVRVYSTDSAITEVYAATVKRIERSDVVNVAAAVIPDGIIVDYSTAPGKFYVDVVAPEGNRMGFLTATPPIEGDYTSGGLRFDMQGGHVPTVEEFFYRLICTNGLEGRNRGAPVSARGSVDQFLEDFAHSAEVKFRSVEETVTQYYEARKTHVPNIEQALTRYVRENKLAAGLLKYMLELVPAYFGKQSNGEAVQETNQFELANFVTNVCLDSAKVNPADRRRMEKMGGAIASDQTHRCPACQNKLN